MFRAMRVKLFPDPDVVYRVIKVELVCVFHCVEGAPVRILAVPVGVEVPFFADRVFCHRDAEVGREEIFETFFVE